MARVVSEIAYVNASRTAYFRATRKYDVFLCLLCNSGCLKINSKNPPCPVDENLNHRSSEKDLGRAASTTGGLANDERQQK